MQKQSCGNLEQMQEGKRLSRRNGPIHSLMGSSIKNKLKQAHKQTNKPKNIQTQQNETKSKTQKVGSPPALRNKMHDDILCVIMTMASENEQTRTHGKTQRGHARGDEDIVLDEPHVERPGANHTALDGKKSYWMSRSQKLRR